MTAPRPIPPRRPLPRHDKEPSGWWLVAAGAILVAGIILSLVG